MSDIKKVNVAENSFLELWRSYCDKKSECESLVEENAQLKADNAELVELVKLSCDRLDMLDSWIESQRSYAEWVNMDELEKRLAKSTSHLYKLIQKHKDSNDG